MSLFKLAPVPRCRHVACCTLQGLLWSSPRIHRRAGDASVFNPTRTCWGVTARSLSCAKPNIFEQRVQCTHCHVSNGCLQAPRWRMPCGRLFLAALGRLVEPLGGSGQCLPMLRTSLSTIESVYRTGQSYVFSVTRYIVEIYIH